MYNEQVMKILDWTAPTPVENLALDEALLDECEDTPGLECLRFWQPQDYFVVLGYSNRIHAEVCIDYCQHAGIPVLRRASGGGTILQGPGCLNYSLILRTDKHADLKSITRTNQFIMQGQKNALASLLKTETSVRGDTDLTSGMLKFSGNAQRRKKDTLLFHGTFLLNFDITMIEKTLQMPERQPEYREKRSHSAFLMNLGLQAEEVKDALKKYWQAENTMQQIPAERVQALIRERYGSQEWIYKF